MSREDHSKQKHKNEQLFAALNRKISESVQKISGSADKDLILELLCECTNPHCVDQIKVSVYEYNTYQALEDYFVVVKGHEDLTTEHVVSNFQTFSVVKKRQLPS